MLAAAGLDLTAKDRWSRTALSLAVFQNRVDVARHLFGVGAPLHPKFEKGRSRPQSSHQRRTGDKWVGCLHLAVRHAVAGSGMAMLELLLQNKCPVDERDDDRATALHEVARAAVLAIRGRSVEGVDGRMRMVVRLLLQAGASVTAVTVSMGTPLHHAVAYGNTVVVEALLAHGADPSVVDADGRKPCDVPMAVTVDPARPVKVECYVAAVAAAS
jgi:ankyrin repeat protein